MRRVLAVIVLSLLMICPAAAGGGWPTPENPFDFLRVHKSQRILEAWRDGIKVRTYRISLGGNPLGHKQQEGDGRTPEGEYILDFRKHDSVAYKAMHISYPNAEDRARARAAGVKPGGAIMIHGQWNGFGWLGFLMQGFDWTNGCIGLANDDMDELWHTVAWGTRIEILP
jgi:murein L,D-transpeptidase YafK